MHDPRLVATLAAQILSGHKEPHNAAQDPAVIAAVVSAAIVILDASHAQVTPEKSDEPEPEPEHNDE